jgi:hypothetical protein
LLELYGWRRRANGDFLIGTRAGLIHVRRMALPFRYLPPKGPPRSTPKERTLAEWRGVNLAPLEKARANTAKPIGQVMNRVFEQARFPQRLEENQVLKVWNSLLDPGITAHAQPVGLARGTLFVNVDSHVWLEEIVRWRRREILERLRHSFGREMIKKISFRVAG